MIVYLGQIITTVAVTEHSLISLIRDNSSQKWSALVAHHHLKKLGTVNPIMTISNQGDLAKVDSDSQDQYCLILCQIKMRLLYLKEQRKAVLLL